MGSIWRRKDTVKTDKGTSGRPGPPKRILAAGRDRHIEYLELDLLWVEEGSFNMGATSGADNGERVVREVRITRGFWMGKTEVTQAQYMALTGSNPSFFKQANRPVERVSWNDAVRFCALLTEFERRAGRLLEGYVYRLPTEAEWEYAARGGNFEREAIYAGSDDIKAVAWYERNSRHKTHPAGTKAANELGLHDMSGNVSEWVHDWYRGRYSLLATTDPTGPASGSNRVYRGGSWYDSAAFCRVTSRYGLDPTTQFGNLGFRLALAPVLAQRGSDAEYRFNGSHRSRKRDALVRPGYGDKCRYARCWCARLDSNQDFQLRRLALYPLNYGRVKDLCIHAGKRSYQQQDEMQAQLRSFPLVSESSTALVAVLVNQSP